VLCNLYLKFLTKPCYERIIRCVTPVDAEWAKKPGPKRKKQNAKENRKFVH
jgi:hypothetical protein